MTTGDGLAMIAGALVLVAIVWATAWASVRNAAIRAEATKRVVEATRRGRA